MSPSRRTTAAMQRGGTDGVSRSDGVVGVRAVNGAGLTLLSLGWPYSNIYVTIPPLTGIRVAEYLD